MKIARVEPKRFIRFLGKEEIQKRDKTIAAKKDSFSHFERFEKELRDPVSSFIAADFREYLNISGNFKESDIKGVCGKGGLTVVFDLGEKEVLKVSLENPLEFRKHNPVFDIPFTSPVEKYKNIFITREIKADTGFITRDDIIDVLKRMDREGFEPSRDLHSGSFRQIGIYDGTSYLLDTRCAMPKPDTFTRFVHDFCITNKKVIYVRTMDMCEQEYRKLLSENNLKALHIDETPRPNLSLTKGLSMMINTIAENIKYSDLLRKLK